MVLLEEVNRGVLCSQAASRDGVKSIWKLILADGDA
jgi:hypothetical protein